MSSALALSQAKYWQLKQLELFAGLPSADLRQLGEAVDVELYEQGSTIYELGDASDRVYILKSGRVKLCHVSDDGRELILRIVGPGEIFGELAIAGEQYRGDAARVVEDAFVCAVGRADLEAFLLAHPGLALELARIMGRRVREMESRVLELVSKDVRTRLAHALVRLADEHGEPDGQGIRIDLRLTQSDLAQLVGSTRETTSTVFNEFRRGGLVDARGRAIWVLDREALRRFGNGRGLEQGRAA